MLEWVGDRGQRRRIEVNLECIEVAANLGTDGKCGEHGACSLRNF